VILSGGANRVREKERVCVCDRVSEREREAQVRPSVLSPRQTRLDRGLRQPRLRKAQTLQGSRECMLRRWCLCRNCMYTENRLRSKSTLVGPLPSQVPSLSSGMTSSSESMEILSLRILPQCRHAI